MKNRIWGELLLRFAWLTSSVVVDSGSEEEVEVKSSVVTDVVDAEEVEEVTEPLALVEPVVIIGEVVMSLVVSGFVVKVTPGTDKHSEQLSPFGKGTSVSHTRDSNQ